LDQKTILSWIAVILLGLVGVLLAVALIALIIMLVTGAISAIRAEWRKERGHD
jgi:hypothetical protein